MSHGLLSPRLREKLITLSADRLPNFLYNIWVCNWEGIERISDIFKTKLPVLSEQGVSVLISKNYKVGIDPVIESFLFLAISHGHPRIHIKNKREKLHSFY